MNTQGPILAIIPARGGSKGIPRKNLVRVGGQPLLAHTIRHALESTQVSRTLVSTDDPEIGLLARELGAEVVDRPAELADDLASSESALTHTLDELRDREGIEPALVVFLQATSPLRPPGSIDAAIDRLESEEADSLFSASPVNGFVWRRDREGLRSLTYDHRNRPRRQDVGEEWLENGSIYVFKPWVLRESGSRLGGKITVFGQHPLDAFQVDEPSDIDLIDELLVLRGPSWAPPKHLLNRIRLLALDFDGVMTDDRVLVDEEGREAVWCSRSDGMGVERLTEAGIVVVVISKETNKVVAKRCRKLGIRCTQSVDDKLPALQALARQRGLDASAVAYVGNDVNDVEPLRWAGVSVAVGDAHSEALRAARWRTMASGGHGAVREVCEWLIAARTGGG